MADDTGYKAPLEAPYPRLEPEDNHHMLSDINRKLDFLLNNRAELPVDNSAAPTHVDASGDIEKPLRELTTHVKVFDSVDLAESLRKVAADIRADRNVDFARIIELLVKHLEGKIQDDKIKESFAAFDKDGNGSITLGELRNVLKDVGEYKNEQELETFMRKLDINKDGELSLKEFTKLFGK